MSATHQRILPRRQRGAFVIVWLIGAVLALSVSANAVPRAAADEPVDAGLARINQARAAIGVAPLKRNPALDTAATAHANYYRQNYGDPTLSGNGLHYEDPAKPGYTGADFAARARAAGYSGSINENIGLSGNLSASIEWFLDVINHRLTLIDPRYTDVGFGVINDGAVKIEVIDLGTVKWSTQVDPAWTPWPPPEATGIGLRFDGEGGSPLDGQPLPTGYPITLKYNGAGTVTFQQATLTTSGQTVPSVLKVGTGFITRNTAVIAATAPLKAGTAYTVTVQGVANNQPYTRTWNFTTKGSAPSSATPGPTPTPAPRTPTATPTATPQPSTNAAPLPAGVSTLDPAAIARWRAADTEVWLGTVQRTWTWGPDVLTVRQEPYAGLPGGARTVYYFDKSRMEINDPNGDRTNPWFVTNGLLVREMIAGQVQVGTNSTQALAPPAIPLAGEANQSAAVTYATLGTVASLSPGQNRQPDRTGAGMITTLNAAGVSTEETGLAGAARYGYYEATTGHNVADIFWRWLGSQPVDWLYAVGYPLTEPYWTNARIDGENTWVLVQAFERRILTFVPTAPSGWQIETGNVGRHYFEWRYGTSPGR